jgi:hypothetical protein
MLPPPPLRLQHTPNVCLQVLTLSFVGIAVLYWVFGFLGASFFGDSVKPIVTLNLVEAASQSVFAYVVVVVVQVERVLRTFWWLLC